MGDGNSDRSRICALLDGVWPPAERVAVVKCFRKTYTTECCRNCHNTTDNYGSYVGVCEQTFPKTNMCACV